MPKTIKYFRCSLLILSTLVLQKSINAQEDSTSVIFKNQISTNLLLPIFSSVDLSYERTLGKKFALGIAGAIYADRFEKLSFDDSYRELDLKTRYEIIPFARIYFGGNQRNSHFLEVFGSFSGVDETGRLIRSDNDQGFGVYNVGTETYVRGGLGVGYGYRFLFLESKLVVEAQFGLRTNFDINFIVLNAALVRTGIRIGYRF